MKIGELLREYRNKRNLTSKQVGESINLSAQAICQYERGTRSIRPEVLDQLINLLEISPEDLARVNNLITTHDKSTNDMEGDQKTMDVSENELTFSDNINLKPLNSDNHEFVVVDLYENVFKDLGYNIALNYDVKNKIYKMCLEDLDSNTTKNINLEDFFNLRDNLKEFLDYRFYNLNRK